MKYTERHGGKAVIREKSLLPDALEKLAKIEELECIPAIVCDQYVNIQICLRIRRHWGFIVHNVGWWVSLVHCIVNSCSL